MAGRKGKIEKVCYWEHVSKFYLDTTFLKQYESGVPIFALLEEVEPKIPKVPCCYNISLYIYTVQVQCVTENGVFLICYHNIIDIR